MSDSFLPTMVRCTCSHRKGIHWYGTGKCGWYLEERTTLRFTSKGKPIVEKVDACTCEKFTAADSPQAA